MMGREGEISRIVLTGPPGVGKSVVGAQVAAALGYRSLDLDTLIEEKTNRSVPDIIRVEGEETFRNLESEVLSEALQHQRVVLALGGGAILREQNRRALRERSFVVLLQASSEVLATRIREDRVERPLLVGTDLIVALRQLLALREAHYREVADLIVSTEWSGPAEIAREVARHLKGAERGRVYSIADATFRSSREVSDNEASGGQNSDQGSDQGAEAEVARSTVVVGVDCAFGVLRRYLDGLSPAVKLAVVVDEGAYHALRDRIDQGLKTIANNKQIFSVKSGEQSKDLQTLGRLGDELLSAGIDRNDCVVAIGGGVVGDLAGLLASLYMRGVKLFHIPTTVVAQVDSALGGKTAINLPGGKNTLGTFYLARATISDIELLRTLPKREYRSGLAEVVKSALIGSAELFQWLEENVDAINGLRPEALLRMVEECTKIKLRFVAGDVQDTKGQRVFLNFGHTVGHALEKMTGYSRFLHGEAVSVGMVCALELGSRLAITPKAVAERALSLLEKLSLLTELPVNVKPQSGSEQDDMAWLSAIRADKKRSGNLIDYVLIRGFGEPLVKKLEPAEVLQAIKSLR
jgi:3-dehydroquinate synthase